MNNWFEIEDLNDLDTPALVVYPDRVKANIKLALEMVGDAARLRPHVKTNKSKHACQLMVEAGISQFKCATIAEAEMLAEAGAKDILLAYQPAGPKIRRLLSLVKKYPSVSFSCLVDNIDSATQINQAATEANVVLPVYIDLNVGMNRTGIIPGDDAVALYRFCHEASHLSLKGLHAYDGHIHDSDYDTRKQRCDEAFEKVKTLLKDITAFGFDKPVLVTGGSPSFPIHARRSEVQCSPGTFIYWDAGYVEKCKEQGFQPAALVVTRVISLPDATTVCTDLGHKSVAAENPIGNRVRLLNAPGLEPIGQSEEHLVLKAEKGHGYKVGDVLYGIPWHICPTCALYERAFTVENNLVSGEWRIEARDRKLTV